MSEPAATVPRPPNFYTEPEWLEVGGVRTAYRRKGQGEPVLFLHGTGFTRMWLPVYERLSERVDLIAPEHPGFGETETPDWLSSFDDLVIHYDELLDALGLDTVHLVGYSLGGWIAAEFATFHPRRLRSLTLIVPPGLRVTGGPDRADIFAMEPEQSLGTIFNDPTNMMSVLGEETVEEVVHVYGEMSTTARLTWNPRYNTKLEHRLPRVGCPALVVLAENDRLIPEEIGARYAELLPNARTERVPGTGHALAVEQPDAAADLIARFVEASR
jgi:pimeloyl-ACP methyl ester carboxylesterase